VSAQHNFGESLAFSHAAEDLPFWSECYEQWFPGYAALTSHRADGQYQRLGVDRSVVLTTGKQVLIDEKVRRKAYDDIAIEFVANDRTGAPGWACKALVCDFIAYAVAPTGRAYLLPTIQLQLAWQRNGDAWRRAYGTISAKNCGYSTISCCVPVGVLLPAIGGCLRAYFSPQAGAA